MKNKPTPHEIQKLESEMSQTGVTDSIRIANKIDKADIPSRDKIALRSVIIDVHDCGRSLNDWKSVRLLTEVLSDLSRDFLNVVGKLDEALPSE